MSVQRKDFLCGIKEREREREPCLGFTSFAWQLRMFLDNAGVALTTSSVLSGGELLLLWLIADEREDLHRTFEIPMKSTNNKWPQMFD